MKAIAWCTAVLFMLAACHSVSTRPSNERMPASSEDTSLDTEDQLDIQDAE